MSEYFRSMERSSLPGVHKRWFPALIALAELRTLGSPLTSGRSQPLLSLLMQLARDDPHQLDPMSQWRGFWLVLEDTLSVTRYDQETHSVFLALLILEATLMWKKEAGAR